MVGPIGVSIGIVIVQRVPDAPLFHAYLFEDVPSRRKNLEWPLVLSVFRQRQPYRVSDVCRRIMITEVDCRDTASTRNQSAPRAARCHGHLSA